MRACSHSPGSGCATPAGIEQEIARLRWPWLQPWLRPILLRVLRRHPPAASETRHPGATVGALPGGAGRHRRGRQWRPHRIADGQHGNHLDVAHHPAERPDMPPGSGTGPAAPADGRARRARHLENAPLPHRSGAQPIQIAAAMSKRTPSRTSRLSCAGMEGALCTFSSC